MPPSGRKLPIAAVALALAVLLAGLAILLLDSDGNGGEATSPEETGPETEPPAADGTQAEIERAVRAYIAAVNSRDGERVCRLLVRGAERELDPPRERQGCGPTLSASIGYADPRGFPVWERTRIVHFVSIKPADGSGRATVEVRHRFADRPTPSIEDDVIHLVRRGDRWLVAKPSSTLYRAIGVAEIPLSALKPPSG